MNRVPPLLLLLACLLLHGPVVWACQYAVRDVGFVSLNDKRYAVTIVLPDQASDADLERARELAGDTLRPAGVDVRVGRPADDRRFADAAALAKQQLPAAVVTDPTDRARLLTRQPFTLDQLAGVLAPLVQSPTRAGLADELIRGYATVLLIEGTDAQANAAAKQMIEDVIARIDRNKQHFDRQIEVGPAMRIIGSDAREDEEWLLWSLEVSAEASATPEVAILFAQGRRLGPVLQGDTLTASRLYAHLAIVAQDCECDLDRRWLYGRRFPIAWTETHRRAAFDALGFDPESALVRAEVSRILNRGTKDAFGASPDPFIDEGAAAGLGLRVYELPGADASTETNPVTASGAPAEPGSAVSASATQARAAQNGPATEPGDDAGPSAMISVLIAGGIGVLVIGLGAGWMIARSRRAAA